MPRKAKSTAAEKPPVTGKSAAQINAEMLETATKEHIDPPKWERQSSALVFISPEVRLRIAVEQNKDFDILAFEENENLELTKTEMVRDFLALVGPELSLDNLEALVAGLATHLVELEKEAPKQGMQGTKRVLDRLAEALKK